MITRNAHPSLSRGICAALLSSLLIFTLFSPQAVQAWGNAGHEAVAFVAWQQLKPEVKTRVITLLKIVPTLHNSDGTKSIPGYQEWVTDLPAGLSQDQQNLYLFMRAATWPDSIKHQWLKDSDTPPAHLTKEVNIGFTDTASHGYWHFVDGAFASDTSKVPATPVPNAATQIAALRSYIASSEDDEVKAYDLIWLEHLVGDVHQPLHGVVRFYAGKGDQGGNAVPVKLPAAIQKTFGSAPKELHAFWDDLPGEGAPPVALPVAAKFAGDLTAAPATDVAVTDPAKWAAESMTMAKKDVYVAPIGKSPTNAQSKSGYLITQAYYDKAMQDAKDRVALAGARLAKLINENLK
jgi:S1/P1 Nuclease